jgi:diacylglycerol kinase family enzyme
MTKNIQRNFAIALGNSTEARHLCRANSRYFLIGVNVGTTSQMFAEVTDEEKRRFGRMAYFRGIARVLLNFQPPDLVITANGHTASYVSTELVVLNQAIQEAIHITPEVKGSEPYFEIVTYGMGNGKLSPLFGVVMFALSFGRNQKYLKRIRATAARIDSHSPQPVAIDGESIEQLPLVIELVQRPILFVRA